MYAHVPVSSEQVESVTSNDVFAIVRTPAMLVSMVGLDVVGISPGARDSRVGEGVLEGVNVMVGVDVIDGV
jgi:hypothetical protein